RGRQGSRRSAVIPSSRRDPRSGPFLLGCVRPGEGLERVDEPVLVNELEAVGGFVVTGCGRDVETDPPFLGATTKDLGDGRFELVVRHLWGDDAVVLLAHAVVGPDEPDELPVLRDDG